MIGANKTNDTKSSILRRFRTAVNKVRFILTTLTTASTSLSWRAVSSIVESSSAAVARRKQRRFANRPPLAVGLTIICSDDDESYEDEYRNDDVNRDHSDLSAADDDPNSGDGGTRSNSWNSRPSYSPGSATRVLLRTTSYPSTKEDEGYPDVDRRAELFIENFYNQLRYEKQISLELRYCKDYSSGSSVSPNSYSSLHIISPVGR